MPAPCQDNVMRGISILEVSMNSSLRSSAFFAVRKLGYSTIQEYIRVHLTKVVTEQQTPKEEEPEREFMGEDLGRF